MGYRGVEATERDLNKFFKTNRPIKNGYTYEFARIYVEDGDTGRVTSSVELIECKQTSELVLPVTKGNIEILLNAVPYIADKIPVNLSIEYIKALGGVFSEDGKTMTLTGYAKMALEVRATCP